MEIEQSLVDSLGKGATQDRAWARFLGVIRRSLHLLLFCEVHSAELFVPALLRDFSALSEKCVVQHLREWPATHLRHLVGAALTPLTQGDAGKAEALTELAVHVHELSSLALVAVGATPLCPSALMEALDMCVDVHKRRHAELLGKLSRLEKAFAAVEENRSAIVELEVQLEAAVPTLHYAAEEDATLLVNLVAQECKLAAYYSTQFAS